MLSIAVHCVCLTAVALYSTLNFVCNEHWNSCNATNVGSPYNRFHTGYTSDFSDTESHTVSTSCRSLNCH